MSLSGVLYVCVAATLLPAICAVKKTAMSRHQLELKEHYEHLAKIAEFECNEPQPRLLTVDELLSDFQTRGKAYFPEVTVLHRCDRHVGSCNDANHQCGPTHATEVKMPFKVTFLEEMGGHAKGDWEMEYHPLQNHTTCGCLKYEGVPPPSKTAVHYHYIDPSLTPPQSFLPLDTSSHDTRGNVSSYDVPVYQFNNTEQPFRNESYKESEGGYTVPSIYDMTKVVEEEVKPRPSGETSCLSCTEYQNPGYPGYNPSSESSVAHERDTATTPKASACDDCDDAAATVIPSQDIRFGADADDSPRSEALTDSDSPYDSYLRQAF